MAQKEMLKLKPGDLLRLSRANHIVVLRVNRVSIRDNFLGSEEREFGLAVWAGNIFGGN